MPTLAVKDVSGYVREIEDRRYGEIMKILTARFGNDETTSSTILKKTSKLKLQLTDRNSFPGMDGMASGPLFAANTTKTIRDLNSLANFAKNES